MPVRAVKSKAGLGAGESAVVLEPTCSVVHTGRRGTPASKSRITSLTACTWTT